MDFHCLPRRDLQALCKRNKIPANTTNAAMADALSALPNVEEIDKLQAQSPEPPATGRGTSARRRVAGSIKQMVSVDGDKKEENQEADERATEAVSGHGSPLPRCRRVVASGSRIKKVPEVLPETPAVPIARSRRTATRGTTTAKKVQERETKLVDMKSCRRSTATRKPVDKAMCSGVPGLRRSTRTTAAAVKMVSLGQEEEKETKDCNVGDETEKIQEEASSLEENECEKEFIEKIAEEDPIEDSKETQVKNTNEESQSQCNQDEAQIENGGADEQHLEEDSGMVNGETSHHSHSIILQSKEWWGETPVKNGKFIYNSDGDEEEKEEQFQEEWQTCNPEEEEEEGEPEPITSVEESPIRGLVVISQQCVDGDTIGNTPSETTIDYQEMVQMEAAKEEEDGKLEGEEEILVPLEVDDDAENVIPVPELCMDSECLVDDKDDEEGNLELQKLSLRKLKILYKEKLMVAASASASQRDMGSDFSFL